MYKRPFLIMRSTASPNVNRNSSNISWALLKVFTLPLVAGVPTWPRVESSVIESLVTTRELFFSAILLFLCELAISAAISSSK